MMPTGRRPKPIERKRAVGRTPDTDSGGRKLPAVRSTIVKTVVVPDAPDGLDVRGAVEWVNIWTAGSSWLASNIDYPWVEMICRAYDDIDGFRARIQADGLIQKGSMGQVISHPLIQSVRQAEATVQKCLSILGFSPSDRARLGLAEVKVQSTLQKMMTEGCRNA